MCVVQAIDRLFPYDYNPVVLKPGHALADESSKYFISIWTHKWSIRLTGPNITKLILEFLQFLIHVQYFPLLHNLYFLWIIYETVIFYEWWELRYKSLQFGDQTNHCI